MKNKAIYFISTLSLVLVMSCNNNDLEETKSTISSNQIDLKKNTQLKEKFGTALAKALNESLELRIFVKNEALKQVTRDYDVIYQVVKNKSVSGLERGIANSLTIREILLPYFQSEAELIEIENTLPLLTIFVPDLLDGSFSAENWNPETEIPFVGIRSYESNDVKIIKNTGEEIILLAKYMPDFPVVVIKDNERVVSNIDLEKYNSLNTEILTDPNESIQLKYASDNYSQIIIQNPPIPAGPRVPQIQTDSYNIYGGYTPGGWQRDYIYYGLTPSHTDGGLNPSYREHLTAFQLSGDAGAAYNWISSSQDPNITASINGNHPTGWTDGNYDFNIKNSYGAKNSNLGASEDIQFSASPTDLFFLTFTYQTYAWLNVKIPNAIYTRVIDFYNGAHYGTSVQFSVWDLVNFSNQWKLTFEEVDTQIESTTSVTQTNKYNANFSIEPSTGILKKIGLKFGASYEQSLANSYIEKKIDISDPLGSSVINFYDNVVNLNPTTNTILPRTYSTGKVKFEFRPIQVQF